MAMTFFNTFTKRTAGFTNQFQSISSRRQSTSSLVGYHGQSQPSAVAPAVQMNGVTKTYSMGETEVHALQDLSLSVQSGDYVAIVGTSGSGKSTLMNIIGLLDKPTGGSYQIRGQDVSKLDKRRLADLRNSEIGFVFQRFNLLARATARRQVELPLFYAGVPAAEAKARAIAALTEVGLADRADHGPEELSGGQQQRVAIARALVNRPSILLADEPSGALDSKTSTEVLAIFKQLNQQGLTVLIVTHDLQVAQEAERIVTLSDGMIAQDTYQGRNGLLETAAILNNCRM